MHNLYSNVYCSRSLSQHHQESTRNHAQNSKSGIVPYVDWAKYRLGANWPIRRQGVLVFSLSWGFLSVDLDSVCFFVFLDALPRCLWWKARANKQKKQKGKKLHDRAGDRPCQDITENFEGRKKFSTLQNRKDEVSTCSTGFVPRHLSAPHTFADRFLSLLLFYTLLLTCLPLSWLARLPDRAARCPTLSPTKAGKRKT